MAREISDIAGIESALRKYCTTKNIYGPTIKSFNKGRHRIIITPTERIYFLYKRAPFYTFLEQFPHMKVEAASYTNKSYFECGDSINFDCVRSAMRDHNCQTLAIVYGDTCEIYEGVLHEVFGYALKFDLRRKQQGGEETISFPIGKLRLYLKWEKKKKTVQNVVNW